MNTNQKLNATHWFLIVMGILFAFVIWPTPYREYIVVQNGNTVQIRVNRFTGDLQMLQPRGSWVEPPKR